MDPQSRHQPDDQARPQRGARHLAAPPGQKIRIGRRNARAGETEEFLAALVRANRAIDDASRGKADVSCASVLPKDLGDWAGTAEFVLGANATGKDLKDISAIDKVRAQERNNAPIACRQGLGTLIAKLGEQVPLALSTPASRIAWSNRDVTVETPAGKIAARAAVITVSSNVLTAGNIKFTPDLPKRQLDAAAKLSLGSYDHIALQLPGNPLGLARDDIIIEQSSSTRTALLFANMGVVAVLDRCRGLVRPRSLGAGRAGDGGVRGGMADQTVRQRCRGGGQEIERDALERRTLCARRDVGGFAGRTTVAQNPDGADRLHVPRRRGDPRDPVGNGRWRLGKRRARGGSRAAPDRRAQDTEPAAPAGARGDGGASRQPASRDAGRRRSIDVAAAKALISWSSGKDSAFALHEVRRAGEFEVVGALTTVTETFGRVSIHGVRQEILPCAV